MNLTVFAKYLLYFLRVIHGYCCITIVQEVKETELGVYLTHLCSEKHVGIRFPDIFKGISGCFSPHLLSLH